MRRVIGIALAFAAAGLSLPAVAEVPVTPAAVPLISGPVSASMLADSVTVRGEISGMVRASRDLGRVSDNMALRN